MTLRGPTGTGITRGTAAHGGQAARYLEGCEIFANFDKHSRKNSTFPLSLLAVLAVPAAERLRQFRRQ
jgi:hypothetical protein